ncbi:MAG: alpha/beta fold hydrolase [Ardenticatenaceae bacterium]|nr:alpha/beta fold hydrolase [Ardenticatenaceae bacterium]
MKFKHFLVLALALIVSLAACQGNQAQPAEPVPAAPAAEESEPATKIVEVVPTNTPTTSEVATAVPQPTNQPTAEPITPPTLVPETAVTQPTTENITIEAADGLPLRATLSIPGGVPPFPGVLLLHMLGSDRQVWEQVGLTDALLADGYAVLALDMRGHGESGGERKWEMFDDDILRVWQYFSGLEEVDEERTAVVGASIGSNLALRVGANEPAIETVILLSPGLDYRRVTTDDAIELYGGRPIFIVASEEDEYSAESSRTLAEIAQGEAVLQMYDSAGHGTAMFAAQPDLTNLILDWLKQYLPEV